MGFHARQIVCVLGFVWLLCTPARADELKLKDGTKIAGRIVGYENDAFKVETSYGYALVLRDKVASIVISEEKKNNNAAAAKAAPVPAPPEPHTPSPPVAQVAPPAPPEPRIREEVEGNVYTNHVYGFRLYKPPSWHIIEGAQQSLPNAVVAMGTNDEATLLVVGRESLPATGGLAAQAATTERRLREIYDDYHALRDEAVTVAGLPAVARRFHGMVGNRDWSGRVIWVARGNDLFTLIGMTTADSDLIQIQENVIAKTVASLEFVR